MHSGEWDDEHHGDGSHDRDDGHHHGSDEDHSYDDDGDKRERVIMFVVGTFVVLVVFVLLCCLCVKKKAKRRSAVSSMGAVVVFSPHVKPNSINAEPQPKDEKCMTSFEALEVNPNAPGMPPVGEPEMFAVAPPAYRSTVDLHESAHPGYPGDTNPVMSPPPKYEELEANVRY